MYNPEFNSSIAAKRATRLTLRKHSRIAAIYRAGYNNACELADNKTVTQKGIIKAISREYSWAGYDSMHGQYNAPGGIIIID